jgi:MSHA biogenesis protein MshP
MNTPSKLQSGFAAIAAIFLVVVLAALGGFMLTFSNAQQLTSAQDVLGVRAFWAARAGLEWGIVAVKGTPALCPNATATLVAGTSTVPVPTSIDGFTLQIYCTKSVYAEAGVSVNIFLLESRAKSAAAVGSIGFVERSVSASFE